MLSLPYPWCINTLLVHYPQGPLAGSTLSDLGLASKPVVCVPAEMPAVSALASMQLNQVSSAACMRLNFSVTECSMHAALQVQQSTAVSSSASWMGR